jgi:hypothetical protein
MLYSSRRRTKGLDEAAIWEEKAGEIWDLGWNDNEGRGKFFTPNGRNPLKRLIPKK